MHAFAVQNTQHLGFRNYEPIQNPVHLQPNLFSTIWISDKSEFQIPTVLSSLIA